MSESPPAYAVSRADLDSDREAIVTLWSNTLGHAERRNDKFDWFYRRNPGGAPTVLLVHPATAAGSSIGVAGVGPRRLQLDGRLLEAGLFADFGVAPEHRTLYPAMLLLTALRDRGLERFALLFGFPNPKSEPVMRRLGYAEVGRLVRYARVVRSADYLPQAIPAPLRRVLGGLADLARRGVLALRRAPADVAAEWQDGPDERFDALWQAQLGLPQIIGVRDRAFLAWRFEPKPWRAYRFLTLRGRTGDLLGYAACETEGKVLHLRDLLVDPRRPDCLAPLLRAAFNAARAEGRSSVSFEFLGPRRLRDAVRALGMSPREDSRVFATAPASPGAVSPLERDWYLTFADQDI